MPPIIQAPSANSKQPKITLSRTSTRPVRRPAIGMLSAVATEPGISAIPVWVASSRMTFW
jgi:hypothetical protein